MDDLPLPAARPSRMACLAVIALALVLGSCKEDENAPYLVFDGGGFIFNYRVSEAFYGFVARPQRSLPDGAVIEARFENPDGPEPIVVAQQARSSAIRYTFRTPPLRHVVADHDYRVELVVLDGGSGKELARYEKTFRTYVGQNVIADKPLTIGPGYALNPEVDWSDLPQGAPPKVPQQ